MNTWLPMALSDNPLAPQDVVCDELSAVAIDFLSEIAVRRYCRNKTGIRLD